ncbi:MAG: hypothetical protein MJK12_01085 [Colwellia sp.]|nr:hypothetical protein [Colwellia sp.]
MKVKQIIVAIFFSCFSAISFAHEGHDHNTFSAVFIHLLWLAPAMIVATVIYSNILKKSYGMKSASHEKNIEVS